MNARGQSDALHSRVRGLIRAFECGVAPPEPFDEIAADILAFQAKRIPGYARLCAARGVDPRRIARAADGPAVPSEAFRVARVFAFEERHAVATFRTSGTTGVGGARGAHAFRDLGTYDAAAVAFGAEMFEPALSSRAREGEAEGEGELASALVLGPSAEEAPDSSLAYMCALFARAARAARALRGSREAPTFFVRGGVLDVEGLRVRIASLAPETPAMLLATSFALVHLFDAVGSEALPLPRGSRVMLTGGFKGRSREVAADDLRRQAALTFGMNEREIVSEYGMTELSSQFWETTLVHEHGRHGVYAEPPWARVVPVDPLTLAPVSEGAVGIARIEDLANVDSAFAVLTHDRVRRVPGGFELLGRAPGSPPRGCSIALDEMLSEGARDHGAQ